MRTFFIATGALVAGIAATLLSVTYMVPKLTTDHTLLPQEKLILNRQPKCIHGLFTLEELVSILKDNPVKPPYWLSPIGKYKNDHNAEFTLIRAVDATSDTCYIVALPVGIGILDDTANGHPTYIRNLEKVLQLQDFS